MAVAGKTHSNILFKGGRCIFPVFWELHDLFFDMTDPYIGSIMEFHFKCLYLIIKHTLV